MPAEVRAPYRTEFISYDIRREADTEMTAGSKYYRALDFRLTPAANTATYEATVEVSGLWLDRAVFINYTLNGLLAGVTALFLTSRMSSTRPNVATSFEMDVIAMVVLGGVSTAGGKGRMGGVLISIFIVGLIRYGLGLININAQILMMVVGGLLIVAVAVPELRDMFARRSHEKRVQEQAARAGTVNM